jgi:tetratricopeptide (TPR) repeat protein
MSDGVFPDPLTQLRARWESDPSSRIFLQLAEEYRHQGRMREALEVLERGLREHPGYLSALVAKGRCLLELGEPEASRVVLERVVKQDATQMVANKLLVRAYIETSEPEKARERLDLYTLLNDSDPEIEELRRRLRAMDQPQQAPQAPQAVTPRPPAPPPAPSRATADDDMFDLSRPAPPRPGGDVFDLWSPPPAPMAAAPAPVEPAAVTAVLEAEEPEPADVLFPGLASSESRRRYLAGLAGEGLFHLDLAELAVAEAAPSLPEPAPVVFAEAVPFAEPFPVAEAPAPWDPLPEPELAPEPEPMAVAGFSWQEETVVEPEPIPAEPEPVWAEPEPPEPEIQPLAMVPEPHEPVATVTLGELYLRQGYPAEAERIFHEVLRREPDNAAALEGLEKLSEPQAARPVAAHDLLAGYQPGARTGEAEGKARKAFLLSRYLERIRRGA